MDEIKKDELFYTLDEEKRELVPNGIQIGDGFKVIMRISKKYITGDVADSDKKVNIDVAELLNITTSLQRKTTADYIPGMRDPRHFSRGNVIGNGRMVCPVLDRELISFIFGEVYKHEPNTKMFSLSESNYTFGTVFEVQEEKESEIRQDSKELVGGTHPVFSKGKEYIYLDDVPMFDLMMIGRADSARNIYKFGELPKDGIDNYLAGQIYYRIIHKVKFVGNSNSLNAMDPIGNEIIDFTIFGADSGWKPLP